MAMKKRMLLLYAFVLFTVAPVSAHANVGTALMQAGTLHLFILNAFIGVLEGFVLVRVFQVSRGRARWWMIDQTVRVWNLKDAARSGESRPLLSLFSATDGAWVAWAEEGYYAASPTGDDIIGWQVDRGPSRPAELQTAFQMHESFYRPDVVSMLVEAGTVPEALKRAKRPQAQAPTETAAETAAKLPSVELVEVGPAARLGEVWTTRSQDVKVRVRVAGLQPDDTIDHALAVR